MNADAANRWLWRFNIRRLDFEEVRDTLLAVSRKLDRTMGGQPFSLGALDGQSLHTKSYTPGPDLSGLKSNRPDRRTVYALIDRSGLGEIFNTFDFADPAMSTGERTMTTVPQQALFMMNSTFVAEQVRNLLARPDFPATGHDGEKVRFIFRVVFQRAPRREELELARKFLSDEAGSSNDLAAGEKKSSGQPGEGPLNTWERYTQVVLLTNELIFVN
jgi:hypothetical protein